MLRKEKDTMESIIEELCQDVKNSYVKQLQKYRIVPKITINDFHMICSDIYEQYTSALVGSVNVPISASLNSRLEGLESVLKEIAKQFVRDFPNSPPEWTQETTGIGNNNETRTGDEVPGLPEPDPNKQNQDEADDKSKGTGSGTILVHTSSRPVVKVRPHPSKEIYPPIREVKSIFIDNDVLFRSRRLSKQSVVNSRI